MLYPDQTQWDNALDIHTSTILLASLQHVENQSKEISWTTASREILSSTKANSFFLQEREEEAQQLVGEQRNTIKLEEA